MSGGGSSTTTSSSTVPPQFLSAYDNTVNRATGVAKQPYQPYSGQLVAGFTPQQTQSQGEVGAIQGVANPYVAAAGDEVNASTSPLWSQVAQSGVSPTAGIAGYTPNLWGSTAQSGVSPTTGVAGYTPNSVASAPGVNASSIGQYENPYQSQVVAATQAQMANTDAQQETQLAGNAASAGAFGGDRMGVAQGVLGGQQAVANNATLAGLNQSNYSQALGEANTQQATGIAANEADTQIGNSMFNTQQAAELGANETGDQLGNSEFNTQQQNQLGADEANSWLYSQAGYAEGNLGNEVNNDSLTDASALATSGQTQQEQQQAGLNTAYEQWQAQQAFPYQQTGWLANITEGIGSNVGGSSTTTQTNNATGGRLPRATGGIVPTRRHFDGGGGILSDLPDYATSYIPSASGSSGGGRGIPNAPAAQVQQNPWDNPSTDISAASGATSLWNNLGLGSLLSPTTTTALPGTAIGSLAAASPTVSIPAAGAAADAAASSPGWMGSLVGGVEAGADAAGTALASGASAIGSGLAAGAGVIGDAAASAGAWLLGLLALRDGGAVEEPQHHAQGGIVLPFPQDRVRRASGGITGGVMPYENAPPVPLNSSSMEAPEQLNGTTGAPSFGSGIMPAANALQQNGGEGFASMLARGGEARAFGGGVGGSTGNSGMMPYENAPPVPLSGGIAGAASGQMFERGGGIVVPFRGRFADGGPPANDDDWTTPDTSDAAWSGSAPAASGIAPPASASADTVSTFTPQKPSGWLPLAAGLATAALGRHHEAGHNIAEGVLAGLGSYSQQQTQYAGQQEKAATIQQEAKRLADDAEFHREQIGLENKKTDQQGTYQSGLLANDQTRTQNEGKYQAGELGLRGQEVAQTGAYQQGELGIRGQEAGTQAAAEKSLEQWRQTQGSAVSPAGTDPATGKLVFQSKYGGGMTDETGQPYTGPVGPLPNAAARVATTERGQDLQHQDRAAGLDLEGQKIRAGLDQNGHTNLRSAADAIYGANFGRMSYSDAVAEATKSLSLQSSAGAPAGGPAVAAPTQTGAPGAGWMRNPSTGQYRSPDGKLFNQDGSPAQ